MNPRNVPPIHLGPIGEWMDRFSNVLDRWENTLEQVDIAYMTLNVDELTNLCKAGETLHAEIDSCKRERDALLLSATSLGSDVKSIKDLASRAGEDWPKDWNDRLIQLELQLNRVQRMGTTLWVSAFQSHSIVSDMLLLIATGRSEAATYSDMESAAICGGQIFNEAA